MGFVSTPIPPAAAGEPEPTPEPEPGEPEPGEPAEPVPEPEPGEPPAETPYVPGGGDPGIPPAPNVIGNAVVPAGDGTFFELGEDGVPLGAWHWDDDTEEWVFEDFTPPGGAAGASLPKTGDGELPVYIHILAALPIAGAGALLRFAKKRR
jgi:hypothetical protein